MIRRTVQRKLCEMQDAWLSQKAEEIQAHADKHDLKNYSASKPYIMAQSIQHSSSFRITRITERGNNLKAEHVISVLCFQTFLNSR